MWAAILFLVLVGLAFVWDRAGGRREVFDGGVRVGIGVWVGLAVVLFVVFLIAG